MSVSWYDDNFHFTGLIDNILYLHFTSSLVKPSTQANVTKIELTTICHKVLILIWKLISIHVITNR